MGSLVKPADIDAFLRSLPKERIVSKECKHATYSRHRDNEPHDMLSIKEWWTLDDGTRWPTMRYKEDYERPFWVTKEHLRDHPDKIQFEDISRTDMFKSTQCNLRQQVAFRLGRKATGGPRDPLKVHARSPYVYGLDPGPEVFMKNAYMQRWPTAFQPNKVTVIDAETDVNSLLDPHKQLPILWSLVSDDEIVLYVNGQWVFDITNYEEQVYAEYKQVIGDWVDIIRKKLTSKKTKQYPEWVDQIEKIPLRIETYNDQFGITQAMIGNLHDTQPDIVTGWNVFFDAKCMEQSILHAGHDPADIFSDPRTPFEYRGVSLVEGPAVKKMSSGREMRLDPQERWNKILNTASWRMQDAMQVYWQLRKAKGKESGGYGLGAVLSRQLGVDKLKYPTEDTSIPPGTIHWHMDMQRQYKVRYGVYNIIDSLGVYVLDKKNSDLSSQISSLAGPCDYSRFNSQPTINAIDMLFSVMKKRGKIICSTSDEMRDENDDELMGKDGWIVTFPSHNVVDSGLYLFSDMPEVQSLVHMFNADADVETTYPTAEIIQNLSKETTMNEPCRIYGVGREVQRLASINLTGGRVNSIEILETVCDWPTLDQWLEEAKADMMEVA